MLRARTPAGVAQEVYALLTCYQILRIAITDAIEAAGGTDPDRGSFTVALNAARDLLVQAAMFRRAWLLPVPRKEVTI